MSYLSFSKANASDLLQQVFYTQCKQGGATVLKEGLDIVTRVPVSLNVNTLAEAAVLLAKAVPISAYR
jgi:hypothetical protein